ncbi:MAG TPA: DEAD/DEAH box helicase [Clostridiales bacterium]|nr:DEAD/DEAH box helicase [Clostridiales bacterium]
MTKIPFSQLQLHPKMERAISLMGFDIATPVQARAIPLIRTGADVIARSQTGTGKTVAFAIPAIESVAAAAEPAGIQVLILCPTRELAQQAAEEIRKVARFLTKVHPVEIYGGAAIDKQCIRLRHANLVIGTPGRVMDHMRRGTLCLDQLKMVVLDEADEMLNMGFKEDIETILKDAPADRQTVLFSATMPPAIMKLTREFQNDPRLIEIDKDQVTIEDIAQSYVDVPHHRKKDALIGLLQYHQPKRAIIFSNTKRMVDELSELLSDKGFSVESIHSDIRQTQRTSVMQGFKQGKTSILIATDIAARGIDVSDIDFVINFDIPMNSEYYVHRIGRTGRAGKTGSSITLCSGRREVIAMRNIARDVKSDIVPLQLPSAAEVKTMNKEKILQIMGKTLQTEADALYQELADQLVEQGYSYRQIAAAAMKLGLKKEEIAVTQSFLEIQREALAKDKKRRGEGKPRPAAYETIQIDIGSLQRVAVNHIVGAITERTNLTGGEIGKVKILPNDTIVEIPAGRSSEVIKAMQGCRIYGTAVSTQKASGITAERKIPAKTSVKTAAYQKRGSGKGHGNAGQKKAARQRYGK